MYENDKIRTLGITMVLDLGKTQPWVPELGVHASFEK